MIPRYTLAGNGGHLVARDNDFASGSRSRSHAAEAMAEIGQIPKEAAKTIWEKG